VTSSAVNEMGAESPGTLRDQRSGSWAAAGRGVSAATARVKTARAPRRQFRRRVLDGLTTASPAQGGQGGRLSPPRPPYPFAIPYPQDARRAPIAVLTPHGPRALAGA